jgi:hypothetical protein
MRSATTSSSTCPSTPRSTSSSERLIHACDPPARLVTLAAAKIRRHPGRDLREAHPVEARVGFALGAEDGVIEDPPRILLGPIEFPEARDEHHTAIAAWRA